jgi:hypothetical protein
MEEFLFKNQILNFVLDSTYIIYAWTIMILKTKNEKMGKKVTN